jgi:toxin ParE1/3/4
MSRRHLIFAPAAKDDLRDIYQHGLRQWGQAQSDRYLALVRNHIWSLSGQPLMGTERNELLPGIRSLPTERHTVFYRVNPEQIDILRILHHRQDPARHVK